MKNRMLYIVLLSFTLTFSCGFAEAKIFGFGGVFASAQTWWSTLFGRDSKDDPIGELGGIDVTDDQLARIKFHEEMVGIEPGDFNSLVELILGVNYDELPKISDKELNEILGCAMNKCVDIPYSIAVGERERKYYGKDYIDDEKFVVFFITRGDEENIEAIVLKNIVRRGKNPAKWAIDVNSSDHNLRRVFHMVCPGSNNKDTLCRAERAVYLVRGWKQNPGLYPEYLDDREFEDREKVDEFWFKDNKKPRLVTE